MAAVREEIEAACKPHGLTVLGVDGTTALIGMTPEGWHVFRSSAAFADPAPDPLDRWSMQILPELARQVGARDVAYPFGGPPYAPFIRWALVSGETFSSPVGMLVHHRAGFWISFRGALIFDETLTPLAATPPCSDCPQPCATACPVGALAPGAAYDVPACKAHVASDRGVECREGGCLVRRACPVSRTFGRQRAQSAFHMRAFLGA